jgi:opacity protein-like surface antigen
MFSSIKLHAMATTLAAAFLLAATAACGQSAQSTTPTALTGDPSTFDGQTVSVTGTAKAPKQRKTRRGTVLSYQLCDTACITVLQFNSDATVSEGSTVSVTGMFRATAGGRVRRLTNVLLVGMRPGGRMNGGASGAPGAAASGAPDATASGAPDASASAAPDATASGAPDASPSP